MPSLAEVVAMVSPSVRIAILEGEKQAYTALLVNFGEGGQEIRRLRVRQQQGDDVCMGC